MYYYVLPGTVVVYCGLSSFMNHAFFIKKILKKFKKYDSLSAARRKCSKRGVVWKS